MEKSFTINGKEVRVQNYKKSDDSVSFELNGENYKYSLVARDGHEMILDDGARFKAALGHANRDGDAMIIARGREAITSLGSKKLKQASAISGGLKSPMPGKIFKLIKAPGDEVKKGETILILEAMKMEHSIRADKDGKLKNIFFKVGELVQGGVTLAEVE